MDHSTDKPILQFIAVYPKSGELPPQPFRDSHAREIHPWYTADMITVPDAEAIVAKWNRLGRGDYHYRLVYPKYPEGIR